MTSSQYAFGQPELTPLVSNEPHIHEYNMKGFQLIPEVESHEPTHYMTIVGEFIFEYVEKIVGYQRAPKVTGMLIDIDRGQIMSYLHDYNKLERLAKEANDIIEGLQLED